MIHANNEDYCRDHNRIEMRKPINPEFQVTDKFYHRVNHVEDISI